MNGLLIEIAVGIGLIVIFGILRFYVRYTQYKNKNEYPPNPLESGSNVNTEPTTSIITPEEVDKFQKLAGIKPYDSQKGTKDLAGVMIEADKKNKLSLEKTKEELINALLKAAKTGDFPPENESITVNSFPITSIQFNRDSDPLGEIPLGRVSKEAKVKIAEIAKQDIAQQIEEHSTKVLANVKPITDETPIKPKRKYNRKPKTI